MVPKGAAAADRSFCTFSFQCGWNGAASERSCRIASNDRTIGHRFADNAASRDTHARANTNIGLQNGPGPDHSALTHTYISRNNCTRAHAAPNAQNAVMPDRCASVDQNPVAKYASRAQHDTRIYETALADPYHWWQEDIRINQAFGQFQSVRRCNFRQFLSSGRTEGARYCRGRADAFDVGEIYDFGPKHHARVPFHRDAAGYRPSTPKCNRFVIHDQRRAYAEYHTVF